MNELVAKMDWRQLYDFAEKQALIGVLFHGIQQLPKELAPDGDLLMTWMGMAQRIKQRNMHFVRYYPAEALSEPFFRTWHFLWRMIQK